MLGHLPAAQPALFDEIAMRQVRIRGHRPDGGHAFAENPP
jgi:hypothetical protein